uniref:Uncharacterized protein n=1 Tax=Oryza sativa subsp. japonica TaxID=39947 RepID=Q33AF7_ORYSJ|nr:hypothetical protein LOC_Os10g10370 [Oryza sativa Japonica Group]
MERVVRFRVSLLRSDHEAPGQIDHMLPAGSVLSYQSTLKHLGVLSTPLCGILSMAASPMVDFERSTGRLVKMEMVLATVLPGADKVMLQQYHAREAILG